MNISKPLVSRPIQPIMYDGYYTIFFVLKNLNNIHFEMERV